MLGEMSTETMSIIAPGTAMVDRGTGAIAGHGTMSAP